ncbi:sigma-70 family RNA polymerase sigma factor [Luteolibacter algae]|uniref:Sigma-70 family RNA polymerase sigma factor n=1 Tax=Luteolibacter algae TaxID=454151 RepID=A0ABW5D7V5_9BACT
MQNPATDSESEDLRYEAFIQRFTQCEPDLRRFIRSLLPTWTDTDEVLQQTAIITWRKFDQYDLETSFIKWACVIARFEALSYRRKMGRDRLVFREELLELMADEGSEEISQRQEEHSALEECLAAMPEKQRQFVTLAYTPGITIKEMADQAGSSAAAFYMKLKRLRHQLQSCIESKISHPSANA